ncbi:MAG: DUF47 family protein [Candidatus Peribacteraceae bacterium]|nr:DUF47 family protein [Candidatus Peribacteraceae bacterium]
MFRLVPKDEKYFDLFEEMGASLVEASRLLTLLLSDDAPAAKHLEKIKQQNTDAAMLAQSITAKLSTSFITPIDREDIYALGSSLQDAIQMVVDTAVRSHAYALPSQKHSKAMAELVHKLSLELAAAIEKVGANQSAEKLFVTMKQLRVDAETLFIHALTDLFAATTDPLVIIKQKDIYELHRRSVESCLRVCHVLEVIVLKHS